MIEVPGTIAALDGQYAVVRLDAAGCGRCDEPGGCGGQNIGRMFCATTREFRVLNDVHAALGQRVDVVIADNIVRRSAALAYGMPLLTLLLGALGGSALAGEVGAIGGFVLGLLLAYWFLRYKTQEKKPSEANWQPYIRAQHGAQNPTKYF